MLMGNSIDVQSSDPDNAVVAHTLHWLAVLLEIDDAGEGMIAAYRKAAQTVRQLDQPVSEVVKASGAPGLERLGFTPAVAAMIADWIQTGHLPLLTPAQQKRAGLWPALTRALCKT